MAANLLGLGVFGTFGQPYGFQQAFNLDVQFSHSLDLDSSEIELFPGTELFAVKREIVRGVYSMCFCMYTYSREINANRNNTFLGSCIVLQEIYIDADKIYNMLLELQRDLVENTQNVNNNTIQARQAVNLVVREPSQFQSSKFGAKSIDETPYYSTSVNPNKKYFVQTGHLENADEVISFFDEALKNYNDAEALYFTFSDKVIDSVAKKGKLQVIGWEEYISYKNQVEQGVVRTKKGLKPIAANVAPAAKKEPAKATPVKAEPEQKEQVSQDIPQPVTPIQQAQEQSNMPEPAKTEQPAQPFIPDPVITDNNFMFNGWSKPNGAWPVEEVTKRVSDYNLLREYAKQLHALNQELQQHEIDKVTTTTIESQVPAAEIASEEEIKVDYFKDDYEKEPANKPLQEAEEDEEEEKKKPFYKRQYFPLIAFGILLIIFAVGYLLLNKYINRKNGPAYQDTVSATTAVDTAKHEQAQVQTQIQDTTTQSNGDTVAATKTEGENKPAESNTSTTADKPAAATPNTKLLSPQPNLEAARNEIAVLCRAGVKNKTLPDITTLIFQKFPTNIGEIYHDQFNNYSTTLLNANRSAFRKKGNDYVCVTDTILHIPAYKSPKTRVVFPK